MAPEVGDPVVAPITGSHVHLNCFRLSVGGLDPDDEPKEFSPDNRLAEGFLSAWTVIRVDDVEETSSLKFVQRRAKELLFRQTGLDPGKGLRLETVDHIDDGEVASRGHIDWL
jgi:hypothetical protein